MSKEKYYAVRVGRVPGIYRTYEEFAQQVNGFPCAFAKSFKTEEAAEKFMGSNRFYAVRVGRIPGVYTNLEEATKQIRGYSNADFKRFSSLEKAQEYINNVSTIKTKNKGKKKEKYYAVRVGLKPGIYVSLKTFNKQMKNFSGAEGRVFKTLEEAQEYIKGTNHTTNPFNTLSSEAAAAQVDGSFSDEIQACSYGCIIFHMSSKIVMSERFYDKEMVSITNVAGELAGALASMQWCIENDIKELHLYYDFSGIEEYCNGNYKARNPFACKYKELYETYTSDNGLKVTFHKIKSHSGDTYNNEVDRIARKALAV